MKGQRETKKRNLDIMSLRDRGWSFGAIATKYGITKQTVHEIYTREKERRGEKMTTQYGIVRTSDFDTPQPFHRPKKKDT